MSRRDNLPLSDWAILYPGQHLLETSIRRLIDLVQLPLHTPSLPRGRRRDRFGLGQSWARHDANGCHLFKGWTPLTFASILILAVLKQ